MYVRADRAKSIVVSVNKGTTSKPSYKKITLNYIDPNIADEKFLTAGNKVADTQKYPKDYVGVKFKYTIKNQD